MISPLIGSWIEQSYDVAVLVVSPRQIRPFESIAVRARFRQIVGLVSPTMLLRDDVFDVKRQERCGGLGK